LLIPFAACAAAALAAGPVAADGPQAGAEAVALSGVWDSPIGKIKLARRGDSVTGVLVSPAPPCPFRAGDEVLRATLLDDSLAGQMRVCTAGRGCPAEVWASALLLIAPRRLAGALHVKGEGDCRAPLGPKGGIALTPAKAAAASSHPRRRDPERARALLRDGAAWLTEGGFERARGRFLEAIEADPSLPEAYNGVGVSYRMRGDLAAALGWYKRALAVDPDFGDAYYNMACLYALRGERTLALRYLQIAAMNGYATAEGIDGDADLASLRATREYRALRERM
jgi:hypothetical protein